MNGRKINYIAVVVAAVAHFVLGAIWFTVFQKQWLAAIGKTVDQLTGNEALGYVVAFACNLIMAWMLAWLITQTGRTSLAGGLAMAALLWLGFTGTTMATAFVFEGRTIEAFTVIAGYPLAGLLIMGAILGLWQKRSA